MSGADFVRLANAVFSPFLADLGFNSLPPTISGRLYSVDFATPSIIVSVFFEPGDNYTNVVVFTVTHGSRSRYDDRQATPRLADLNRKYMGQISADARLKNDAFFAAFEGRNARERQLIKCAKELRLVLPLYMADSLLP